MTYRALALGLLCGCGAFPDVDGRIAAADRNLPYPILQPIDPLLAKVAALGDVQGHDTTAVAARIARLNARAAVLRRPVIDRQTRNTLLRGVAVPAAIR